MMQARWIRPIGVAGALALVMLAVGAAGSAQAQTDDSVDRNPVLDLEQRVWGTIVRGLGLRDPNAPSIDYRERSPLVVPPTQDLPPPQARATPRDPTWPADPDVAKARKANEAKRKPGAVDLSRALDNQARPIPPDQLDPAGSKASGQTRSNRSNAPTPGAHPDGNPVAPSELGYFGGLFSLRAWGFGGYQDETGTFTNEPPRTQLTEPPPGYQTPSSSQPYGVTRRVERAAPQPHDPAR
jgi:hypothetical protein